jgi:hypothetical protein
VVLVGGLKEGGQASLEGQLIGLELFKEGLVLDLLLDVMV